jgi:streptogramin lyase
MELTGTVQSGGSDTQMLGGALVTLFSAGVAEPVLIGQATTNGNGAYSIASSTASSSGLFYATANLGNGVLLLVLLGRELPQSAVMNELTTVAGAYCAAQFISGGKIQGNAAALRVAAGMNGNLVDIDSGEASAVMTSSPNGSETNALQSLGSLACVLASCVRDRGNPLDAFFGAATPPYGTAPTDTITALANIARHPANHVGVLYYQSKIQKVYLPALSAQPDAWTIVVKVNDSGDDRYMFGGPANLVFDANGNAWIANNVVQGQPYSTAWCIVLDATGRPARNAQGTRMSPFTGGGLLGAGFGVDIDSRGRVWIGDFGWGKLFPTGSVSSFNLNAEPLSPSPDGFYNQLYRVQGTVADDMDNIWLASYGNGRVVVYPEGQPGHAIVYSGDPETFKPFGIAIAADGSAWVTNGYTQSSAIVNLRIEDGRLTLVRGVKIGRTNKGIAIDSKGIIWVGSGGDNHVYAFEPDGTLIGGYQGGGIYGPWGVTIDGQDNLWVANFGPLEVGSVFTGRLTQLAGSRATGYRMGDALSPQTGYTVPSAGAQVLLHDGTPLYGPDGPPCYTPMMRTTGVNIDAAGNVWTCNNWKPSFNTDLIGDPYAGVPGNPGGDGIMIFVGLAKPR